MKNKLLMVSIFLIVINQLFGLNMEDLNEVKKGIAKNIPNDSVIFIKCENEEINSQLIPYLIENDYEVVENYINNCYIIDVKILSKKVVDSKRILIFKKENKKRINNLIFKIIEPKNSQIVYYKKFQYTKKITNNKTNWYESALITTIVGGLAYLFYFGTN
jgi:hypothetical protein